MKLIYLSFYMGSAAYFTFSALYLRGLHLDGFQIGFTLSIVPLAGVVLQPVWGHLSDHYRLRNRLLALALLAAAAVAPCVLLAHSFLPLIPLVVALAVTTSPIVPLTDATTLDWLARHRGSYGSIRIFGSLGFFLGSLLSGPLLAGGRLRILFPVYGLFLGLGFLASLWTPRQTSSVEARRGSVRLVLGDRVVAVFLVLAVLGFGTFSAYNTFYAIYMQSLGAGTAVIGFGAGLASLSELPVMALSGRVIARVGTKPLLLLGMSAAAFRWLLYGSLHDYRIAFIFQVLHGLTFAGSYVAGVTFIDRQVPAHLRSTGQTLFYGASFGLGAVAGSNLFGALFDRLQVHGVFLAAGGIALVAAIGMALLVPNRHLADEAAG